MIMNFSNKNYEHLNKNCTYVGKTTMKILALIFVMISVSSCHKDELYTPTVDKKSEGHMIAAKVTSLNSSLKITLENNRGLLGRPHQNSTVVFKDKLWTLTNTPYRLYSDGVIPNAQIWSSEDGTNWNLRTDSPFNSRSGHSLVTYDNKMWVIGGLKYNGIRLDYYHPFEVWNTSDGIHWNLVSRSEGVLRSNRNRINDVVVFKGKMFLHQGESIYSSTNGINWILEAIDSDIDALGGSSMIVFKDHIYIIGGYRHSTGTSDKILKSNNGRDWSRVRHRLTVYPNPRRFSPRGEHDAVVYNNKVWIVGGLVTPDRSDSFLENNEIWYSKDMQKWEKYEGKKNADRLFRTSFHTTVNFKNKIWLLNAGPTLRNKRQIWSIEETKKSWTR